MFEGYFKDDQWWGDGIKTLTDGTIFRGKWKNNKNCVGDKILTNGETISGEFDNSILIRKFSRKLSRRKSQNKDKISENSKITMADKVQISLSQIDRSKSDASDNKGIDLSVISIKNNRF